MLDINIDELKGYLGIDYADDIANRRLEHLIKVADKYLESSLGRDYPSPEDDARVMELVYIIILVLQHIIDEIVL